MRLSVLGSLEADGVHGPIALGGPKQRAVIAMLALHADSVVPEDHLIEAVWGEGPPRTAARTLQAYISRLRAALAAGDGNARIETAPGGYRLRLGAGSLDVHRAQSLASRARDLAAVGDHSAAAAAFAEALALWRGPPLVEFATARWAEPEARRLADLQGTLLEERFEAELASGRDAAVLGELATVCRANPTRERLWHHWIVALHRAGRDADALTVYRELEQRPGSEPGAELRTLVQRIAEPRAGGPDAAPAGAGIPFPDALAHPADDPFVGRSTELTRLLSVWDRACSGESAVLLIGGEPGIGKSRLVGRFARHIRDRGGTVLFGTCEEDLDVAYQPFAEALSAYVTGGPEAVLSAHVRQRGGDLARLVPQLRSRVRDVPAPLNAEPGAERLRLFEAVAGLLADAAAANPVLLVLDDLQWANRPTLLLLRHLVREPAPARLVVVGMYRDTELSRDLAETLADLHRLASTERIGLTGFDTPAVIAYLEALGEQEIDEQGRAFAHRLREETGGSPFFVSEIVRHLAETGAVHRRDGVWTSDVDTDRMDLPASVRDVIGRRVGRLSDLARRVLAIGSVIGPQFSLDLVEHADGTADRNAAVDAMDEAAEAGMLRAEPGRPGTYTFAHALIRQVIHDGLSDLRRARMHRRVAEALESGPEGPSANLTQIAVHYLAGAADGVATKAMEYAARAARRAIDRVAYEEAVRLYEQGLEVAEWAGEHESGPACDLMLGAGRAYWKTGDVPRSRAMFAAAAELARRLDDPERFARAALRAPSDLGGYLRAMASDADLVARLEEALARLGDVDLELRARLLARLAVELYHTGPALERRAALAEEAVDTAGRVPDKRVSLYVRHCREISTIGPDVPSGQRLASARGLLRLAEDLDDPEAAYQIRFLSLGVALDGGDFAAADAEAAAGERLAERLRMPGFLPWVAGYRSLRSWIVGDLASAEEQAAAALAESLERAADPGLAFALLGSQTLLFRYLRDLGDALTQLDAAAELYEASFPALRAALALAAHQSGDRNACRAHLEAVVRDDLRNRPRDGAWLLTMSLAADACTYLGDEERSAILYDELVPFADRWAFGGLATIGPVGRLLGSLVSVLGEFDAAEAFYEHAVEQTEAAHAPIFHAEACHDFAAMLVRRGRHADRERARQLIETSAGTARALGLATLVGWTGELRDRA